VCNVARASAAQTPRRVEGSAIDDARFATRPLRRAQARRPHRPVRLDVPIERALYLAWDVRDPAGALTHRERMQRCELASLEADSIDEEGRATFVIRPNGETYAEISVAKDALKIRREFDRDPTRIVRERHGFDDEAAVTHCDRDPTSDAHYAPRHCDLA
jgi:hypothetical protein